MTDDTIISMQETIAHQQAEIDRLSDELYAQQKDMAAIKAQLDLMIERVKTVMEHGAEPQPDGYEPPPPHY